MQSISNTQKTEDKIQDIFMRSFNNLWSQNKKRNLGPFKEKLSTTLSLLYLGLDFGKPNLSMFSPEEMVDAEKAYAIMGKVIYQYTNDLKVIDTVVLGPKFGPGFYNKLWNALARKIFQLVLDEEMP